MNASFYEKAAALFAVKKAIVHDHSVIFEDWHKLCPSLTKEDFLEGIKWLCYDPCVNFNPKAEDKPTRELALSPNGLVHIKRCYDVNGSFVGFYKDNLLWDGELFKIPAAEKDLIWADEDGNLPMIQKISINILDRI